VQARAKLSRLRGAASDGRIGKKRQKPVNQADGLFLIQKPQFD
jgi:hypothetical protein